MMSVTIGLRFCHCFHPSIDVAILVYLILGAESISTAVFIDKSYYFINEHYKLQIIHLLQIVWYHSFKKRPAGWRRWKNLCWDGVPPAAFAATNFFWPGRKLYDILKGGRTVQAPV